MRKKASLLSGRSQMEKKKTKETRVREGKQPRLLLMHGKQRWETGTMFGHAHLRMRRYILVAREEREMRPTIANTDSVWKTSQPWQRSVVQMVSFQLLVQSPHFCPNCPRPLAEETETPGTPLTDAAEPIGAGSNLLLPVWCGETERGRV